MLHVFLECIQVAIDLGLILMLACLVRRLPSRERKCSQERKPLSCSTKVSH